MPDKVVKVVGKHVKNCFAVSAKKDGRWNTCWGPVAFGEHGHPTVTTERRYGKNGRRFKTWLRFVCNDPSCKAELHVECEFILETATKIKR